MKEKFKDAKNYGKAFIKIFILLEFIVCIVSIFVMAGEWVWSIYWAVAKIVGFAVIIAFLLAPLIIWWMDR
jgi:hypothetical protein